MKKLILVFAAMAFSVGAFAQTGSTNQKTNPREIDNQNQHMQNQNQHMQNNPMDKTHPDGVVMQDGKLMKVKNGKLTALDHEMTLSNGTKITTDGNYTKMDGTTTLLEEGQHLDESGNMTVLNIDRDAVKDRTDQDRTYQDGTYQDRTDQDKKDKDRNMYLVPDSARTKDVK